jgi:quercetin dioxygenase-like cupin family protein
VRNPDVQSAIGCAHVRFAPGARTAWHSHPKGQTLYVTDGIGLVAHRGSAPSQIRPGDVVYIEPNEEHWHGATPDRFMAHVAMQEADDQGQVVTWLEHVAESRMARSRSSMLMAGGGVSAGSTGVSPVGRVVVMVPRMIVEPLGVARVRPCCGAGGRR